MHQFTLPALVACLAVPLAAQGPDQEELAKRRTEKLAEPWLENAAWQTDYDAARAAAAESGKLIFAYFTRSYSP